MAVVDVVLCGGGGVNFLSVSLVIKSHIPHSCPSRGKTNYGRHILNFKHFRSQEHTHFIGDVDIPMRR